MRESAIEGWSKKYAKNDGWWARKFKSPSNNAEPDDIFAKCKPNGKPHSFFVEFKRTGEEASPLQLDEHEEMRAAGLTVYVCDSRERFAEILKIEEAARLA